MRALTFQADLWPPSAAPSIERRPPSPPPPQTSCCAPRLWQTALFLAAGRSLVAWRLTTGQQQPFQAHCNGRSKQPWRLAVMSGQGHCWSH